MGQSKSRLVALDILRGFFLFVIIVDHTELFPSIIDFLSGKGRLWVSAAEGFFFISGLLVGYIYRRKLADWGMRRVWTKLWRRAGVLYVCATSLTLLFTVWAVSLGGHFVKYGLPPVINWPDIVAQTLLLRYTYGWGDFLTHYVVFMLAAPLVFWLLTKNKWWLVVAGSVGLWLVRGQEFQLAWQVLFVGGMIAGYYWKQLHAWVDSWQPRIKRTAATGIFAVAGATFAISYLSVYLLGWLNDQSIWLPHGLAQATAAWDAWNTAVWPAFEKWTLEPGRIILFGLWFAAAYLLVERFARRIPPLLTRWLVLLGTNSLFVYGLHAVVVFVVHVWAQGSIGVLGNFLVTVAVLVVITCITWLKTKKYAQLTVRHARRIKDMIMVAE